MHLKLPRTLPPLLLTATIVAGCATNPATGNRELSLMSEAQEIELGRQMDAQVREEMGVYSDPELQRYVAGRRHAPGAGVRSTEPAVAIRGGRFPGGERLCPAGRLHLSHARHPAVPRQRGAARRCARPRDRARHRAPLGAAVLESHEREHRPDAAEHLRARSAALQRPGARTRSACCSSSMAATRNGRPTRSAPSTPPGPGGTRRASPAC